MFRPAVSLSQREVAHDWNLDSSLCSTSSRRADRPGRAGWRLPAIWATSGGIEFDLLERTWINKAIAPQ
jgi:hypothetical protein